MPLNAPLKFSVKYKMVDAAGSMLDHFKLLKRVGFDGVELDSPNTYPLEDVRLARDESGLSVEGVVNSIHWEVRLSDPDPAVRAASLQGLMAAIHDAKGYGGHSVLLVPGGVKHPEHENHQQVWERSITELRKAIPLAADLGIMILIENVWNGFCYEDDGPEDQTAHRFADYIDEINSPWVGVHFDIGNHVRYSEPAQWIRTLGKRIVKLDVKDYDRPQGQANPGKGFQTKIGNGSTDWPEVREALSDIGYAGWACAEVEGGGESRLVEIKARMDQVLRGV